MATDESTRNLEETKERLYAFTYAAAILDAASSGNRAWLRESIIEAAKKYDIDLKEKTGDSKIKEAYKKAFQEELIARGILEKTNATYGYKLSDDPRKRDEFGTLIFNVRCKKQEMEVIRSVGTLTKAALKAKEGTLNFIATQLHLGPKAIYAIGVGLLTTIRTLQQMSKGVDDLLSDVRTRIVKDILHLENKDIVRSVFESENERTDEGEKKHGPEDVLGQLQSAACEKMEKEAEKKVKGFMKVEGPTLVEAHFSDEQKEEAKARSKRVFENKRNREESIGKRCADFMQDAVFYQVNNMIDAYLEIDKDVNPDDRATLNIEKAGIGIRSLATRANYVIPHFISFACGVNEFVKEFSVGLVSRSALSISTFLHKGFNNKHLTIRATAKFMNMLIYGIDYAASFAAKKIIPVGEFSKAEYDIRHYNIKETDERKRGKNYAKTYSSLNVYRAGRAEYIVGAFRVFHMQPKDCLWAMAYLTAGINATRDGVVYDLPKGGKFDGKEEITENHDKNLEKKATALYEKYEAIALDCGIEAALEKMKDNFIDLHHKAIDKSEKLREQSGLAPLSKIGHYNRLYDNAPVKEASYIKIKEMTKEEYREEDINKTFESNDAIYLKGEFTGSLQLLGETRIVVATIDETNCAVSMDVTNKMFCPDSEARNELKAKEDTLDLVTEKEQDLLRYDALTAYAATFDDRNSGNKAAIKWLDVAKDLIATDNYVSYIDESKECGFKDRRTGVELKFTNCEPAVEMTDRCVTMKRFAKDILKEELRSISKKHYISERSIKEIAELADHTDTAEKNILARIDKTNCIRSINEDLKLLEGGLSVKDTVLRIDKRCEIVDDMEMLIGNFDKARAISDNFEREMKKYKALAKTDPILALCKTIEPNCEREGEYITLHLADGTDFAISQKDGRLAERCNQLDDRIMELQKVFIDTIKDARDQGADLLDIPGETNNIEEQEIDQDEIER